MLTGSQPMARRGSALAVSVALVAGSALTAGVTAESASAATQTVAATRLEANLHGTSTGDPNGSGHVVIRLFKAKRKVCAAVTWRNIGRPNAAHIHRRSDGGIVVNLTGSVTGGAHCARHVSKAKIRRIATHPRRYYFNVHNATYPAGAIQGTLHR